MDQKLPTKTGTLGPKAVLLDTRRHLQYLVVIRLRARGEENEVSTQAESRFGVAPIFLIYHRTDESDWRSSSGRISDCDEETPNNKRIRRGIDKSCADQGKKKEKA